MKAELLEVEYQIFKAFKLNREKQIKEKENKKRGKETKKKVFDVCSKQNTTFSEKSAGVEC